MIDEGISDCALCQFELNDELTTLPCGHIFHFDCIMRAFEYDHKSGKPSKCSLCRDRILRPPNKWYTKLRLPVKEYEIPSEVNVVLKPNNLSQANKRSRIASSTATSSSSSSTREDNNAPLIEYYEGRVGDLERQLEERNRVSEQVQIQQNLLLDCEHRIIRLQRDLDARNVRMTAMHRSEQALLDQNSQLKVKLQALQEEMESFKYLKTAIEVERLATQIAALQATSYYHNLVNDNEIDKSQLALMLAGMKQKYQNCRNENEKLERDLRIMRIGQEKSEKLLRRSVDMKNSISHHQPIKDENTHEKEINTTYADTSLNDHNNAYTSTSTNRPSHPTHKLSSKLVPNIPPKGLKRTNSTTVTDGTGKQVKILELSNGNKFLK